MEKRKLKAPTSSADHCRNCKAPLYEDEDAGSICGDCIFNFIQDSKKEDTQDNWMGKL